MMDDGLCVVLVLCVYRIQIGWRFLEIKNTVSSRSVGSAIPFEIVLSRKSIFSSSIASLIVSMIVRSIRARMTFLIGIPR